MFYVASVMPRFEEDFRGLPGETEGLPAVTRVMMSISSWLVDWWWAVGGCFLALLFIEMKRAGMVVPTEVLGGVVRGGRVDIDDRGASFGKTAGQKTALSPTVVAIAFASFWVFATEIEGSGDP